MNTTIQIPAKLLARVEKAARALDVTVSAFVAQVLEERLALKFGNHTGNLPNMLQARRVQASRAAHEGDHDPLVLAANTAHHTLRTLAEAVGCSHVALSRARHGTLSIPMDRARQIEALTGFKATRDNWPRLRADEPKQEGRKTHGRQTKNPRQTKGGR